MRPHLPLGVFLLALSLAAPFSASAVDQAGVVDPIAAAASPAGAMLARDVGQVVGKVSSLAPQSLILSLAEQARQPDTAPGARANRAVLAALWSPPNVSAALIEKLRRTGEPGAERAAAQLAAFVEQRRTQIDAQRAEIAAQVPDLNRLSLSQSVDQLFDGASQRISPDGSRTAVGAQASAGPAPQSARLLPASRGQPGPVDRIGASVPSPKRSQAQGLTPQALQGLRQRMLDVEAQKRGPAPNRWIAFRDRWLPFFRKRTLLNKEDFYRLARTLTTINTHFVDPIPAQAWDETLSAMSRVAQRAFRPEKDNWPDVVTLMLRVATRRLPDLHSDYLDEKRSQTIQGQLNHSIAGIGMIYRLRPGGLITYLAPNGAAQEAGLKLGDRIVSIDGVEVSQIPRLNQALATGSTLRLRVERDGQVLADPVVVPAQDGADLRVGETSDFARITSVVPGGPAAKAGVRVGDVVVSMDGVEISEKAARSMSSVSGEAGTALGIQLQRDGRLLPEMKIVRSVIELPNVFSKLLSPRVGYLYLAGFSPDAAADVFAHVRELRSQGARKLILDLRSNPGGDVRAEREIVSAFLKDGQTIESERGRTRSYEVKAAGAGEFSDMSLVVLVNGRSASASESVAGTLQDYGVPVVGSRTFGKGTTTMFMPDGKRTLLLTTSRWYTPKGRNFSAQRNPSVRRKAKLQGTGGLVPDHEVAMPSSEELLLAEQIGDDLIGQPLERSRLRDPVIDKALELLDDSTTPVPPSR